MQDTWESADDWFQP
ncbi:hypothetical protein ACS78O_09030 [Yersinia enterocolitica]